MWIKSSPMAQWLADPAWPSRFSATCGFGHLWWGFGHSDMAGTGGRFVLLRQLFIGLDVDVIVDVIDHDDDEEEEDNDDIPSRWQTSTGDMSCNIMSLSWCLCAQPISCAGHKLQHILCLPLSQSCHQHVVISTLSSSNMAGWDPPLFYWVYLDMSMVIQLSFRPTIFDQSNAPHPYASKPVSQKNA